MTTITVLRVLATLVLVGSITMTTANYVVGNIPMAVLMSVFILTNAIVLLDIRRSGVNE